MNTKLISGKRIGGTVTVRCNICGYVVMALADKFERSVVIMAEHMEAKHGPTA